MIGSSILRAIAVHRTPHPDSTVRITKIRAYDHDADTRAALRAAQLADEVLDTLDAACAYDPAPDRHFVVFAPTASVVVACIRAALPQLAAGTIISDVNSTKTQLIEELAADLARHSGVDFVPAHPVAGTENSGVQAGLAELFQQRPVIIVPLAGTRPESIAFVAQFWEQIGAWTQQMTPEHHDRVLAVTSHIPHLVAYTIVGTACNLASDLHDAELDGVPNCDGDHDGAGLVTRREITEFAAGGFRDFTRIAASDPEMWQAVFMQNRGAVLDVLGRLSEDLHHLQRAIRYNDTETLVQWMRRAREVRRGVIDAGQAGSFYSVEKQE